MKYTNFHLLDMPSIHPSDQSYLDKLFYGDKGKSAKFCIKCNSEQMFYPVKGRKWYQCRSGHQVSPLTGTIMEGTRMPLWKWFKAIDLFSVSLNGISAMELQRQLDIGSYRHAFKMSHDIRKAMETGSGLPKFTGTVEVDETYIGGRKKVSGKDKIWSNKSIVFGILQRNGNVKAFAVERRDKATIIPLIRQHVEQGSKVFSDEHGIYKLLVKEGYEHDFIRHNNYKWANGEVSTNAIEGFWSLLKRGIRGTHIHVSNKMLQNYLNEFCFRYNRRKDKKSIKQDLLQIVFNSSKARGL